MDRLGIWFPLNVLQSNANRPAWLSLDQLGSAPLSMGQRATTEPVQNIFSGAQTVLA